MPPITQRPANTETHGPAQPEDVVRDEVEANDYLLRSVGDLLYAGTPDSLPQGGWSVPILLGNVCQGELGTVGTLMVSADGIVCRLSPDEWTEVQNRARLLAS